MYEFVIVEIWWNVRTNVCKYIRSVSRYHADGSRVSIAIIRVCDSVCVSVCPHDKTKRLKLKSPDLAQG